ncbi:MAG: STAS domain-containing protein [Leptospiraceae bacterium]|nr:STAS domain-containing protein [Leptospiraceae bacterium]
MEAEVTILKLKDTLIVPVQVELHDNAAKALQEKILMSIEKENAQGLIIDISGIFIVDSFLGRILAETAKMAKLIGAKVVLTGMRKEVVMTLIQLGLNLKDIDTALNLTEALEKVNPEFFKGNEE